MLHLGPIPPLGCTDLHEASGSRPRAQQVEVASAHLRHTWVCTLAGTRAWERPLTCGFVGLLVQRGDAVLAALALGHDLGACALSGRRPAQAVRSLTRRLVVSVFEPVQCDWGDTGRDRRSPRLNWAYSDLVSSAILAHEWTRISTRFPTIPHGRQIMAAKRTFGEIDRLPSGRHRAR